MLFDPLALDLHKPKILKPSLAQWDNYQIHTLYCVDVDLRTEITKTALPTETINSTDRSTEKMRSFLAVQVFSPVTIPCNFDAIVRKYP